MSFEWREEMRVDKSEERTHSLWYEVVYLFLHIFKFNHKISCYSSNNDFQFHVDQSTYTVKLRYHEHRYIEYNGYVGVIFKSQPPIFEVFYCQYLEYSDISQPHLDRDNKVWLYLLTWSMHRNKHNLDWWGNPYITSGQK